MSLGAAMLLILSAGLVGTVSGALISWFVILRPARSPRLPCPVCGSETQNCHGKVTSACGPTR